MASKSHYSVDAVHIGLKVCVHKHESTIDISPEVVLVVQLATISNHHQSSSYHGSSTDGMSCPSKVSNLIP